MCNHLQKQQRNQTSNSGRNQEVITYNKFLVLLCKQDIPYSCLNSCSSRSSGNNNNQTRKLIMSKAHFLFPTLQNFLICAERTSERESWTTAAKYTNSLLHETPSSLLFLLLLYLGLQEMLVSPWKERFRLPLSAQEESRYLSSSSCSSFCKTKARLLANYWKTQVRESAVFALAFWLTILIKSFKADFDMN
jgi:hypothetical protein